MQLAPAISILPVEGFVPVLRSLEHAVSRDGVVVRKAMTEVFQRVAASAEETARTVRAGAQLVASPTDRVAVASAAAHFDAAAAAAREGVTLLGTAPPSRILRPFEVPARPIAPVLTRARESFEAATRELATVPEVGVPPFPKAGAADAADAATIIAARRAAARAELDEQLTRAERSVIDRGTWSGPTRQAVGSAPVHRALNLDVLGAEHLPRTSNSIIAPVHTSSADLLHAHLGHEVPFRTIAVEWLWRVPGLGPVLDRMGAFPVTHGNSASGMRIATGALLDGQNLLMYPSGTIPMVTDIMPARRGAAVLAIKTGTPVVPVGEYGTAPVRASGTSWGERLLGPRPRGALVYGEPIPVHHLDPANRQHVMALTAEVERRQHELSDMAAAHVRAARG